MDLITPEFGLLFWMVVIFGIVFFLLAKFGFPVITQSVEKRNAKIAQSLKEADEIQVRMETWKADYAKMMEDTKKQQSAILREATETSTQIVADARKEAQVQADKIMADARVRIAQEKETALAEVRKEIGLLSVSVAEKILRRELSDEDGQRALLDQLVDEASQSELHS